MKKIQLFLLLLIISFGFLVRLYRFDYPIADWHSWRQTDTSSVSRMLLKNNFDIFKPKFQDLSNIPSGLENPKGYRFVEFPIYNIFQAGLFVTFGRFTLEEWGRIVTIISSLSASLIIFLLVKRHIDYKTAILSAFFYTFLPYSIFYGRTLLPDITMATVSLAGVYFFDSFALYLKRKEKKQWIFFLLSIIFCASALLLKPFAIFILLPIIYIIFKNGILTNWKVYVVGVLSVIPLILWRMWMQQFPEGIPVSDWLFNGGNMRFKGAFFYWVFDDHIGKTMLGYFGAGFLTLGLIKKNNEKKYGLFVSLLISSIVYLFIVARGNIQHDYYQIIILPTIAIFLGRGASYLLDFKDKINKMVGIFSFTAITFLILFSSWYIVRDYFNINNMSIVVAGKKADEILPKDAKVIAPQDGSTVFLYYTGRQGWPAFTDSIEKLIEKGATHLVIASPTSNDFSGFGKKYEIVAKSSEYLILSLR